MAEGEASKPTSWMSSENTDQDKSEVGDATGMSLVDFCVQLDDCTPTVCNTDVLQLEMSESMVVVMVVGRERERERERD